MANPRETRERYARALEQYQRGCAKREFHLAKLAFIGEQLAKAQVKIVRSKAILDKLRPLVEIDERQDKAL